MSSLRLLKLTWGMRLFAWWRIPLLAAARPVIEVLEDDRCVVRIPLRRRTRNHLGSMYFGALAIGADCAAGLMAVDRIRKKGAKVALVFKSFQAQFLKRPEGDVRFVCEEGARIGAMIDQALTTGERVTEPISISAFVTLPEGTREDVAAFTLELSLKPSDRGVM